MKWLTLSRMYGGGFLKDQEFDPTTSNNGEERACVQCGQCIEVCPVELMPNLVFKHALLKDIEKMESTFIHDCVDCGLCTFVCPSKIELAQVIEDGKTLIVKEG
jgi:Na+-translocating ferredoxin:NAD+ oxidoreductase RnfC subunit